MPDLNRNAGKLHVLVIDDDVNIRVMLKDMLERKGYVVGAAKDGRQGLEFVEKTTYDLIVLDIKMPYVTGLDFLKELKQVRPNIPVLMITGEADSEKVKEAARHGVKGFLLKPFKPDELYSRVSACLA